jgi:hypothetical protein
MQSPAAWNSTSSPGAIHHPARRPGESSRLLSAEEAIEIANTATRRPTCVHAGHDSAPSPGAADGRAGGERTNRPELIDVAGRIDASQDDEIAFMQQWLRERGERGARPDRARTHAHPTPWPAWPRRADGRARPCRGHDFDRLFLQLMITHHEGAVNMVEELLEQPGSAYDPVLFEFTADVTNDQTAEIERMNALLVGLSDRPARGPEPPASTMPGRRSGTWNCWPRCPAASPTPTWPLPATCWW